MYIAANLLIQDATKTGADDGARGKKRKHKSLSMLEKMELLKK